MKSKPSTQKKSVSLGPFAIAFLAVPLLALTPNFFVIPDLSYQGLATQELVFAITAAVFAALGLTQIIRAANNSIKQSWLSREDLLIFGSLAVFILWQLISLLWAPTPAEGLRLSGVWLGFGVFFAAGYYGLHRRSALWLHDVMTGVCAILAISLIYEKAAYGIEMFGIFFSHGISAELLALMLPLQILNYLYSEKRPVVVISLIVSGLSLVALLMGMRRGAVLGTVFVLVAIGAALAVKMIQRPGNKRLAIVAVLFVLAAAAVGVRYREEISFRLRGATQLSSAEGGLTTRLRGWITAWEMGKRNALIGVGNAGYPSLYGSYRRYFVSDPKYTRVAEAAGAEDYDEIRSPLAHNEYLQTFVELGIVGLGLFLLFWALIVRRLWRPLWRGRGVTENYWVLGALLGLITFGISSATSAFSVRFTPGAFLLPCVLAIGFAFSRFENLPADEERPLIAPPKIALVASVAIALIACILSIGRSYNVYASQLLQGRASLRDEPLDFVFFPNDPAGNERLQRRYQRALEIDPANAGAHLGYGLLLFQMKKPAEAIPQIEYALKNGYSRPFAYALLAFAYEQTGDLAKAAEILGDCAASYPQSIFARAAYAEILRKDGKIDQMRAQQQAMYQLNQPLAMSWELALKMKREEATAEANRRGVPPPDQLRPRLVSALVGLRAFHYLK